MEKLIRYMYLKGAHTLKLLSCYIVLIESIIMTVHEPIDSVFVKL